MKIVYEQGDVVYNTNNCTYGIVICELLEEQVRILEFRDKDMFINCPPKTAMQYCGHIDFKKTLQNILVNSGAYPTEKVCTGKLCPMQVGYDVEKCKLKECMYRTEIEKGGVE